MEVLAVGRRPIGNVASRGYLLVMLALSRKKGRKERKGTDTSSPYTY